MHLAECPLAFLQKRRHGDPERTDVSYHTPASLSLLRSLEKVRVQAEELVVRCRCLAKAAGPEQTD